MLTTRLAKTFERLRAGQLPPVEPNIIKTYVAGGLKAACSGCGEAIELTERSYWIRIGGCKHLRFHLVCHETWIRFKRPA
jgi:hypothetical protein